MEHVLLFAVVAFLMYNFIGGCNCNRGSDGFRVGGQQDFPCKCSTRHGTKYFPESTSKSGTKNPAECGIPMDVIQGYKMIHDASYCNDINDKTQCNTIRSKKDWWAYDPEFIDMFACKWDDNYKPCSYKDETKCNNDKNCSWCMELNGDKQRCNTLDNAKKLVDSGAFECNNLPPSN